VGHPPIAQQSLQSLSSAARSSHAVGVVLAMLGAMAFSGKAIIVKLSYRYGVDAVTVIMYRMLLASAISYALYLMFSGELVQRIGAMHLVGLASCVACVLAIAQFVLLRPLSSMVVPAEVVYLALLNATLCTVLPVLLIMLAIERIGAALTAQTGMVGPMATVLLGVWVLGEPMNAWIGMGTVLVLGGVYVASQQGEKNGLRHTG
jgi:drug/metabolite transporter (DMT)-like permease